MTPRSSTPALHHAAVGRRARGEGDRRSAARRARCAARAAGQLDRGASHQVHWDRCSRRATTRHDGVHASARRSTTRRRRRTRRRRGQHGAFNSSMASLGGFSSAGSGAVQAEDRVLQARSAGSHALRRHGVGGAQRLAELKRLCPEPPSTYYTTACSAASPGLHGAFAQRGRREQHLLRDRLPAPAQRPNSKGTARRCSRAFPRSSATRSSAATRSGCSSSTASDRAHGRAIASPRPNSRKRASRAARSSASNRR